MDTDWRAAANCREVDPNRMQPERATPDELETALAVCKWCPVGDLCRELAESQPNAYGIHDGEWFGDPPANPLTVQCEWCGTTVLTEQVTARYCGGRCRVAAHRARALSA